MTKNSEPMAGLTINAPTILSQGRDEEGGGGAAKTEKPQKESEADGKGAEKPSEPKDKPLTTETVSSTSPVISGEMFSPR